MLAGPRFKNSKNHGPTGGLNATMGVDSPSTSHSSGNIRTSVQGEMRDMPGQMAFSQLTTEYGAGRHTAYDSPLAQPAYSEHGKVGQF